MLIGRWVHRLRRLSRTSQDNAPCASFLQQEQTSFATFVRCSHSLSLFLPFSFFLSFSLSLSYFLSLFCSHSLPSSFSQNFRFFAVWAILSGAKLRREFRARTRRLGNKSSESTFCLSTYLFLSLLISLFFFLLFSSPSDHFLVLIGPIIFFQLVNVPLILSLSLSLCIFYNLYRFFLL